MPHVKKATFTNVQRLCLLIICVEIYFFILKKTCRCYYKIAKIVYIIVKKNIGGFSLFVLTFNLSLIRKSPACVILYRLSAGQLLPSSTRLQKAQIAADHSCFNSAALTACEVLNRF